MKRIKLHILFLAMLALLFSSCEKEQIPDGKNVLIIYSMGFNSIYDYLKGDLNELMQGYIPSQNPNDNILLVFYQTREGRDYPWKPSEAALYEVSRNTNGKIRKRKLLTLPSSTVAASAEVLEQVLLFVKNEYPDKNYGMLMSSHGAGWVPSAYCQRPSDFENGYTGTNSSTFGIGDHYDGVAHSGEIDLKELGEAIPMKLDYLIFDACFMGGIEVAYELRGKVGKLIFSQAEIAGEGMDYLNMCSYLLKGNSPDLQGFTESFYRLYENDATYGCTISMIDAGKTSYLAGVCKYINEMYGEQIAAIPAKKPQIYFRSSTYEYFYDLFSIYRNADVGENELALLQEALDDCIVCKYSTPSFMYGYHGFLIKEYSGLSMYLPMSDRAYLNDYYKGLKWNKATGLVK